MASPDIPPAENATAKPAGKKNNTGSRLAVAGAFSFVGAKFGWIGTAIDARELLRDKPTLGAKLRALFSKELWENIAKKISEESAKGVEEAVKKNPEITEAEKVFVKAQSELKAQGRLLKWSIIIGIAGTAIGAVVGWVRGDRLGNPKDVLKHPIKSTKLVFGPKPKEPEQTTPVYIASSNAPAKQLADNASRWQEQVTQPQAEAAVVSR